MDTHTTRIWLQNLLHVARVFPMGLSILVVRGGGIAEEGVWG